jgi:hypothetical protein
MLRISNMPSSNVMPTTTRNLRLLYSPVTSTSILISQATGYNMDDISDLPFVAHTGSTTSASSAPTAPTAPIAPASLSAVQPPQIPSITM